MDLKRNKILRVTFYIISITFYSLLSLIAYKLLLESNYYNLLIIIPLFLLLITLIISNVIKLLLTIISMLFGRNDNTEVNDFIANKITTINRLSKYVLIAIFITLLTSVMILDIIICVNEAKYELLSISIVIWILSYHALFKIIVKIIRKEIRL